VTSGAGAAARATPDAAGALTDPGVRELYVRILRGTPRTIEQIREIAPDGLVLGAALEELESAGLVSVGREGLEVHNPRTAVAALVSAGIARRRPHWVAAAEAVESLGPLLDAWSSAGSRSGVAGTVSAGDGAAWWETVRSRDEDAALAVLHLDLPRTWLAEGVLDERLAEREAGLRLLLPSVEAIDPDGARIVEALIGRGTEVRLMRRVPGWLYAGRIAAVTLRWQERAISGVTTSGDPSIVAVLTWMFEDWWERGVDYDGRDVFSLLAAGHEDAEIAALLGTSVRTVHRRVAEAMDAVGARSRFELGMAWARSPRIVGARPGAVGPDAVVRD
jgi:hypothetical protein